MSLGSVRRSCRSTARRSWGFWKRAGSSRVRCRISPGAYMPAIPAPAPVDVRTFLAAVSLFRDLGEADLDQIIPHLDWMLVPGGHVVCRDRKSTRLNSSHSQISYAVFCLKKKKK